MLVVILLGVFYFFREIYVLFIDVFCCVGVLMVVVFDYNLGLFLMMLLLLVMNMVVILFEMILVEILCGVI